MYVLHHADQPQLYAGLARQSADQPDRRGVEGRQQVCRHGRRSGFDGRRWLRAPPRARGRTGSPRRTRRAPSGLRRARNERHKTQAARHIRGAPLLGSARINHWIMAISFVLLLLSGLSLFHPSLFFLTGLFGGGADCALAASLDRRGARRSASSACSCASSGRTCRSSRTSSGWRAAEHVLTRPRRESARGRQVQCRPEVGVLVAGRAGRRAGHRRRPVGPGLAYFEQPLGFKATIDQKRLAALIHAIAAVLAIVIWIIHVYAAIWVRGTIGAMTAAR